MSAAVVAVGVGVGMVGGVSFATYDGADASSAHACSELLTISVFADALHVAFVMSEVVGLLSRVAVGRRVGTSCCWGRRQLSECFVVEAVFKAAVRAAKNYAFGLLPCGGGGIFAKVFLIIFSGKRASLLVGEWPAFCFFLFILRRLCECQSVRCLAAVASCV